MKGRTTAICALSSLLVTSVCAIGRGDEVPPVYPGTPTSRSTHEHRRTEALPARSQPTRPASARQSRPRTPFDSPFSLSNGRVTRLARAPNMFGDSYFNRTTLFSTMTLGPMTITADLDLPLAGGAKRLKIADNNSALPTDRLRFEYQHFANPFEFGTTSTPLLGAAAVSDRRSADLNRYTFGWEQTLFDDEASLEVRMPIAGRTTFANPGGSGLADDGVSLAGGEVGNLSLVLKGVLYEDRDLVLSTGLGIELPTGDDAVARVGVSQYVLRNEAVHIHPFLAATALAGESFYHGFLQVDLAANGNGLDVRDVAIDPLGLGFAGPGSFGVNGRVGEFTPQTLIHLDVGAGRWLFRETDRSNGPSSRFLRGLAAMAEVHYTGTPGNGDMVANTSTVVLQGLTLSDSSTVRSRSNRVHVVNFTTGVHAELMRNVDLRVGAVFPLADGGDRFFDAEFLTQINWRY